MCAVELLSVDALQEIRVSARSRSSRGGSARVLARSSRNDIVAVKFKLDEKQRERIAHEFPAASQLTHASQIRLKSVISVRLCRLWLAAADKKRLRGASRVCQLRLARLRKKEVDAPSRQCVDELFFFDDVIFM